jgi:hypothetical protein
MAKRNDGKLNQLEHLLPEGLIVDAAWLTHHGYSSALRSHYVTAGWLEQISRSVYRRPAGAYTRATLSWQQVVISLQTILNAPPLVVGGRTALDLHGYAHYLSRETREVHLYGSHKPPGWLQKLPLDVRFVLHNDGRLFRNAPVTRHLSSLAWDVRGDHGRDDTVFRGGGLTALQWGQWDWPLTLSTPERAILELLDELPRNESFHQVDMLMEGLVDLSPRRLQALLRDCSSVKVKRLFFFFADRHAPSWLKRLDRSVIDLGSGKRMLVRGGRLDPRYQITVPEDLSAVP